MLPSCDKFCFSEIAMLLQWIRLIQIFGCNNSERTFFAFKHREINTLSFLAIKIRKSFQGGIDECVEPFLAVMMHTSRDVEKAFMKKGKTYIYWILYPCPVDFTARMRRHSHLSSSFQSRKGDSWHNENSDLSKWCMLIFRIIETQFLTSLSHNVLDTFWTSSFPSISFLFENRSGKFSGKEIH